MGDVSWAEWLRAWGERLAMAQEEAIGRWIAHEVSNEQAWGPGEPQEYLLWQQVLEWQLEEIEAAAYHDVELEDKRRREELARLELE